MVRCQPLHFSSVARAPPLPGSRIVGLQPAQYAFVQYLFFPFKAPVSGHWIEITRPAGAILW